MKAADHYDNPSHWKELHKVFGNSLKSVGRSGLSETYNQYKYRSEEQTFVNVVNSLNFDSVSASEKICVLDIGAGTGYWLQVINSILIEKKKNPQLTAFDLSAEAISQIKKMLPGVTGIIENAGTTEPMQFDSSFHLVMSNYCLHHITNTKQFMNALYLAINAVKPGGYLLLMDCLIDRKFSPYYSVNADTYRGSGLSRALKIVDEACEKNNMRRIMMADPISYLMNNVLEADSESGFHIKRFIWKILQRFYKSETTSRIILPFIFAVDKYLKSRHRGNSTRLVIFQKQF